MIEFFYPWNMSFNPYDLLKKDLTQAFEHDIKVQAMQNIIIVALAIGEQKTKVLLENLAEFYTNQPEEVVVALACRLGDLLRVSNVKAEEISEELVQHFLKSVDGLSNIGSQHVNDGITHSFKKFFTYYVGSLTSVCTFIQTLSNSQSTLQRSLCATLIPILYQKVDQADQADKQVQKQTLGQVFGALVQDQDALVRQECARSVKTLVEQIIETGVCDKYVRSPTYIFACFDRLIQDLADQVRSTNVENGISILRLVVLLKETIQDQQARELREVKEILPQLIKAISRGSSDRYWRIRYKTAQLMPVFFEQIHKKLDVSDCAVMHRLLTEDVEQDIRIISILNSDQVLQYLDSNTCVNVFVPALLARVAESETVKVKCQLAKQLPKLIIISKQCQLSDEAIQTLNTAIEDICRKLLADKDQEVRACLVESLADLHDCYPTFVLLLLKEIFALNDAKWLVRNTLVKTVEHCVDQGAQIGELIEEMLPLLTDQAYEVRENAAQLLVAAGLQYSIDWLNKNVMSQLLAICKQHTSNFQNRIACCLCIVSLLKVFQVSDSVPGLPDLQKQIVQFSKDTCVYVRNQVVERIHQFYQFLADTDQSLKPEIKSLLGAVLEICVTDQDEHVKTLAEELKEMLENF